MKGEILKREVSAASLWQLLLERVLNDLLQALAELSAEQSDENGAVTDRMNRLGIHS